MKIHSKFAAAVAILALSATPALAQGNSGSHTPTNTKHYGKFCQGQSKTKTVPGKGKTAFALCVGDMAKLANGSATNPHAACKNLPKKHLAHQTTKGTAYSACVSGAKKLLKQQSSTSTT